MGTSESGIVRVKRPEPIVAAEVCGNCDRTIGNPQEPDFLDRLKALERAIAQQKELS